MDFDEYDLSFSSISDRINGNIQKAKKELLQICKITKKAEQNVEDLEEKLSSAKSSVIKYKNGIYNILQYFYNHNIAQLTFPIVVREGKTIYIINRTEEDDFTINVETESI